MNGIYFPGLGIFFNNVPSGFSLFGVEIKFYGILIALGFMFAYIISAKEAKRTGQNEEVYLDLLLALVIPSILGARIYYILFNSDDFISEGMSFLEIVKGMINLRNGGLGIYGGLMAGVITIFVFGKIKKVSPLLILDTITMGILFGQIMGRWGNFFNREAFGAFSNGITRMAIPIDHYSNSFLTYLTRSNIITEEMMSHQEVVKGFSCITVHPTFIYEGIWNVGVLIFIFLFRKKKTFDGQIFTIYMLLYGIGRFFIEALRADSLMIGPLKISQVVAAICVVFAIFILLKNKQAKPVSSKSEKNELEKNGVAKNEVEQSGE